jgi:hypothetical protein
MEPAPAHRSDKSWLVTSLIALACAIVLLGIGLVLAIPLALSGDSCGPSPTAFQPQSCTGWQLAQNDWTAGWRLAVYALPAGIASLLLPHRVKWLWLRIPLLLTAVCLCAAPVAGFMIGIGH